MQRFDPDAISRKEERLRPRVPECQGEHAAQPADRGRTPFFIGVDDRLCVRRRIETVSRLLEVAAKLAKVVDLAVEHDPDGAILVVDWLIPCRQVDDAQPAHAERHAAHHQETLIVGASVPNHVAHAVREMARLVWSERCACGRRFHEPGNATHDVNFLVRPRIAPNACYPLPTDGRGADRRSIASGSSRPATMMRAPNPGPLTRASATAVASLLVTPRSTCRSGV